MLAKLVLFWKLKSLLPNKVTREVVISQDTIMNGAVLFSHICTRLINARFHLVLAITIENIAFGLILIFSSKTI